MSRFWCSKCGWHRKARPEDPTTVHCGNSQCGYMVSQRTETKEEVRAALVKNLCDMCSWSEDYAKGFVAGAAMVEDKSLAVCAGILEKLVEAKMLRRKLEHEHLTANEVKLVVSQYKKLRDEGWTEAFSWFGWDVDVVGFPPKEKN